MENKKTNIIKQVILFTLLFFTLSYSINAKADFKTAYSMAQEKNKNKKHEHLWGRITHNYKLKYNKNHTDIIKFKEHYHNYHVQELAKNAHPYLHHIIEELETRNMPGELALLPMVESSFNPYAISPVGPSGIWQLHDATGQRFGLEQDGWYDGRLDILSSTSAALDYLEYLHRKFNSDWLLAIAAYNCGEGRVSKAIHKNIQYRKKTDFWSLDLPKQTKEYIPKLLALSNIILNPKKHSINLPPMVNSPYLVKIDVGTQIDLACAAKISNMDLDKLKALNPGYTKWATHPKRPHILLLPKKNALIFEENMKKPSIKNKTMASKLYKIKAGDNLIKIAKRFKISLDDLKERNSLISDTIIIGKYLFIPHYAGNFKVTRLK